MRKILFIILATFVMIFIGASTAEEFSLRNGIKFGMSKAEVESIEANNSAIRIGDAHSEDYAPIHLYVITDSIEGFSPYDFINGENKTAKIDYCFTSEDKLFRVIYHLDSTCDVDDTEAGNKVLSQFGDVSDFLGSKYKLIAEGDNQSSLVKFSSPASSHLSLITSRDWQLMGIDGKIEKFKQYLTSNDDSYVDIYLYAYANLKWEGATSRRKPPENICIEFTSITDTLAGEYLSGSESVPSNKDDEVNRYFNAVSVDRFHNSNSKWVESDSSRALLVACLISDIKGLGNCPYDVILSSGTFVLGCNGPIIMLYAYHPSYDEILSIMYVNAVDHTIPEGQENSYWSVSEGMKEYNSQFVPKIFDELGFESVYDIPDAYLKSALYLMGVD